MGTVLIAGAAGLVGRILWDGLSDRYTLRGLDRRRDRTRGIRRGDVRRPRTIARAFDGVDTVVDLAAGASLKLPWDEAVLDCSGRVNVLEAAREHGVRRYVFASSNHVSGLYDSERPYADILAGSYDGLDPAAIPLIDPDAPPRPDGPYAVGKVFAEAAARYYAERHGLSCLCLRIGAVTPSGRPTRPMHYAKLLSHADLVQLVVCAIGAPATVRFGVYYGVSANTWRIYDIENARREIGYEPQDDAERFRVAAAAL